MWLTAKLTYGGVIHLPAMYCGTVGRHGRCWATMRGNRPTTYLKNGDDIKLQQNCRDVSSGLHKFRDAAPSSA